MTPIDGLSFQLYSARDFRTLEDQFKLIADIGYRRIELYGALLAEADRLKELLIRHAMTAPSAHVALDDLRADAAKAARTCRGLGIDVIFAPSPPLNERDQKEEGWRSLGRELREIGRAVNGEGLRFGWHNHHWEYGTARDGTRYLDILFNEAPDLLWEADLGWISRAGADPAAELRRLAARVAACHVKDIAPEGEVVDEGGWADPGHGVLDWTQFRAAMKDAGVKLYVVEHDKPSDVARFARRAWETVASWS